LLSIEQAHLDACALMAPSSLAFIERLVKGGGRVRVPTTLSMVSLDLQQWRELGIEEAYGDQATRIAEGYLQLGCVPTWTCAPYQGYLTPRFGQQIAWGESNAVAYANSVLGARTNRYGDYLDVCAAITGRVPLTGLHLAENRRGQIVLHVRDIPPAAWRSPATWAALGHLLGTVVGDRVPVVDGLPGRASGEQLKALAAAAASSGGIALFHLVGITPEAPNLASALHGRPAEEESDVTRSRLARAWDDLSCVNPGSDLDAVVLGCPHFSYAEFEALARTVSDPRMTRIHPDVQLLIFTHTETLALASRAGLVSEAERFGATIVLDTCPFYAPVVAKGTRTLMTNSGKCAYYAPGELRVDVAFGTLRDCLRSAASGKVVREETP